MPVRMLRSIEKDDGTTELQYKTNPQFGKWHTVPMVAEDDVVDEDVIDTRPARRWVGPETVRRRNLEDF